MSTNEATVEPGTTPPKLKELAARMAFEALQGVNDGVLDLVWNDPDLRAKIVERVRFQPPSTSLEAHSHVALVSAVYKPVIGDAIAQVVTNCVLIQANLLPEWMFLLLQAWVDIMKDDSRVGRSGLGGLNLIVGKDPVFELRNNFPPFHEVWITVYQHLGSESIFTPGEARDLGPKLWQALKLPGPTPVPTTFLDVGRAFQALSNAVAVAAADLEREDWIFDLEVENRDDNTDQAYLPAPVLTVEFRCGV